MNSVFPLRALAAEKSLQVRRFGCFISAAEAAIRTSRSEDYAGNSQAANQKDLCSYRYCSRSKYFLVPRGYHCGAANVAKAAIARRFCAYRTTVITYSIGKISGPACLYACRASRRSNNFAMDGLPSCTSSLARISMVRRTNCSIDASLTVGVSK